MAAGTTKQFACTLAARQHAVRRHFANPKSPFKRLSESSLATTDLPCRQSCEFRPCAVGVTLILREL